MTGQAGLVLVDAAEAGFVLDSGQRAALAALAEGSRGVYLSGAVGRGKSWLADAWFRHAPGPKLRVHFHAFLDELHRAVFARQTALREARLAGTAGGIRSGAAASAGEEAAAPDTATARTTRVGETAGFTDVVAPGNGAAHPAPVSIMRGPESDVDVLRAQPRVAAADPVADAIADLVGDAELLVFDEFHLHDPADALLLSKLLEHAAAGGIRVLATSNYAPADLLPDPGFHDLAEPAIALIGETMTHVRLDGDTDYRGERRAPRAGDPDGAPRGFADGSWLAAPPAAAPDGAMTVRVRGREFEVVSAGDELWLTFDQLCTAATSAIEYLDWAARFSRWVVLNVPSFDGLPEAARQRFLTAVDVLVDRDVETVFVSDLALDEFALSAGSGRDAARLTSRLSLLR